jgi:hypothetical protein
MIPQIGNPQSMAAYLTGRRIRLFDYPRWAEPFREQLRENAEALARENGLEIEFVRRKNFRKEARVAAILRQRGDAPGLVHVFSAMEACPTYKPWHDKKNHTTFLKHDTGRCLHYYFYFIDRDLGLCYLRVPTWAPFRLQFYMNGHNWLARQLEKKGVGCAMADNAFVNIDDWEAAQQIADRLSPAMLHKKLDQYARRLCPVSQRFDSGYHWSLMQVEYASDIVFKQKGALAPIYDELVRTAIHTVQPDNVATFLGRKLDPRFADELGGDFHTRVQGTRLKHHMGKAAIKMYDKHATLLRIETTANDVSFFKHHRYVEHRDGTRTFKLAPVRKTIYSLQDLRELLAASNRRYLEFISAIDDPSQALKALDKIARPVKEDDRSHRGFNLFQRDDLDLFRALLAGEFAISGFRNKHLRAKLPDKTPNQISRMLKRLRTHKLIKTAGSVYKYYLTIFGRLIITAALQLREMTLIPKLRGILANA